MPDQGLTIAVTGSDGYLGRITQQHLLARGATLRLLDRAGSSSGNVNAYASFVGSIADRSVVARTFKDAEVVVHLAADLSVDSWDDILENNIQGTYNVFEEARLAGVRRIIYASSHHVSGMYPTAVAPIGVDAPPRPDSLYGVSKCFGEALARYYWDKYGLETVALRIGSARPQPLEGRERYTWLSEKDYCGLLDASLDALEVGFTPIWGISNNDGAWWDNSKASSLPYFPKDNAARHLHSQQGEDLSDPLLRYHGGKRALHNLVSR